MTDASGEIDRLQRRLERERAARQEAERVAERALLDLHVANRELTTQNVELERFTSVIALTPDAIIVVDRDGRIVEATARIRDLFGYEPSEVAGQPVEILVPTAVRDGHVGHRARFAEDPRRRPMGPELDLQGLRKDGTTFPVEISLAPVATDDGLLVVAAVRDVSEHRRATALARMLQRVGVASNETVDPEDAFAIAIEEVCEVTGFPVGHAYTVSPAGELIPTDVWHIGADGFERFRDVTMRTTLTTSAGIVGEVVEPGWPVAVEDVRDYPSFVRGKAGDLGVRAAFALPVSIGREVVAVLEFFAGEPRTHEADFLEAMMQVGTQVGRVVERSRGRDELAERAVALERSNAELAQFAYIASHDLQEPLRMVTGYLQLLERRFGDRLDTDAHEFIDFAVDGAKRMQELIEDLLAYSRVGQKAIEREEVDAAAVLRRVLSDLAASIEETNATVTHDELPRISVDVVQFGQLLQNLLSNAVKFRGDDRPAVHVGTRRDDAEWIFEVRDNGIGIDPGLRDRIFAVFQRLHTRDEYPGTGIGLAIAQKIVERHGGRIWVDSEPGTGTTFSFSIPDAQP